MQKVMAVLLDDDLTYNLQPGDPTYKAPEQDVQDPEQPAKPDRDGEAPWGVNITFMCAFVFAEKKNKLCNVWACIDCSKNDVTIS